MSIMSYSGFIRLHDNKQFSVLYSQEQTKKHRTLKKSNWVIRAFLKCTKSCTHICYTLTKGKQIEKQKERMFTMKNEIFNFAARLEDMLLHIKRHNEDLAFAAEKLMADNGLDYLICGEPDVTEGDRNEFELDISEGYVDPELYSRIARSIRLLSLAGQKPQKFMHDESDFLFGCPIRYNEFSDDDIDAIRFDPNVEAIDDRTFYYVWLYIGEFEEIKMAAKIDSEIGTVHPLPYIPVKSKYDINNHANNRPLTAIERKTMIDRIFYASLIPDEITDDNDKYSEWSEDIEDDEEDEVEWIYPDDEDEDEEGEWTEDIDDDEEEDIEWIYPDDEDEDEEGEWTEDIDDDDDDDINKVLAEETGLFDEHTITITVLSVTDLHEQPRTLKDGTVYDNIQGFVGKIFPIVIGEGMTIYDPGSNVVPIPEEKLHTSPVIFHSEELISDNETKHVVRTARSIYTFIEHRKNYSSTAESEAGGIVF